MRRPVPGLLFAVLLLGTIAPLAHAGPADEERLVSFHGQTPHAGQTLGAARVTESFPFAGVAVVSGTPASLARLSTLSQVAGVYASEPLTWQLERSRATVRADVASTAGSVMGGGVTIALVDSGIDAAHPGFEGRILESVRIARSGAVSMGQGDADGHGTHVAGILAGDGARSQERRMHGVAPGADLVSVDISESFTTTSAVRAFQWIHQHRVEHDIRVVSNSWGREKADAHYDPHDPVIRASDALVADGIVVVFSAGNRGRDGAATLTTEATNPNVLTVGAASASGRVEPYSSRGPAVDAEGKAVSWTKPDLVAPGTGIVSARTSVTAPASPRNDEDRYYAVMNGTSMAAPHVAAAAALLLEVQPDLTPSMVMVILQATSRDLATAGADFDTGHGMLDVGAAVQAARSLDAEAVTIETRVPLRIEGSVAAAAGHVLVVGDTPHLPPQENVVLPLSFPTGATHVDVWFNWSGQGAFAVHLEGPGGARHAFKAQGDSLHLSTAAQAGAYRVVVVPEGVAAHTPFVLEGSVVVHETRMVEAPAEFTARAGPHAGGFFLPQSTAGRLLSVPVAWVSLGLLAAVSTLAGVAFMRRRG